MTVQHWWSRGSLLAVTGPTGAVAVGVGLLALSHPGPTPAEWWFSLAAICVAGIAAAVVIGLRRERGLDAAVTALARAANAQRDGEPHQPVAPTGPAQLRQLAWAFNDLGARMDLLLHRQRAFVSYASHQLRTPLGTLRLCLDNLRPQLTAAADPSPGTGTGASVDDRNDDYDAMVDEIERMIHICDSLLAYARAEATAAQAEDLNLSALVAERVQLWEPAAALAGVSISRAGMDQVLARAATAAIGQCLDAFIDNAVKYAGAGSTIVVATYRLPDGWVQLDVTDDGPGLPAAELDRAAQAFWRHPHSQNKIGSGLGVTIADALITASGGVLTLMAARPRGLRAHIRLPAARAPQ